MKLVFLHGWFLDRTLWTGVLEALGPLAAGAVVLDEGYYGRRHWPEGLERERRWLGIGQSAGALQLLADPPVPLAGVVAIDGFARYGAAPDFPQGIPQRVLQRMQDVLTDSGALPTDFVAKAGGARPPGTPDIPRLIDGLHRLRTQDGRAARTPIWSIHADKDPIASLAMADTSFAHMDVRERLVRDANDHLSPLHDAERCAGLIRRAIQAPVVNRIAGRFGRAAATYDAATPIQQQVAEALATRIAALRLPPAPRVAEFGSGTGRLARLLWPRLRPSLWVAADLAPEVAAALPAGPQAVVMDAARPALASGFDLVCSSMTLQWLDDPAGAVAAWRVLGGALAVAVPVGRTFGEWRQALAAAGAPAPGPRFASADEARAWFAPGAHTEVLTLTERHADALAFARSAKRAGIDAGDGRSLDAGTMRRALAAFGAGGAAVTYEVMLAVETAG